MMVYVVVLWHARYSLYVKWQNWSLQQYVKIGAAFVSKSMHPNIKIYSLWGVECGIICHFQSPLSMLFGCLFIQWAQKTFIIRKQQSSISKTQMWFNFLGLLNYQMPLWCPSFSWIQSEFTLCPTKCVGHRKGSSLTLICF